MSSEDTVGHLTTEELFQRHAGFVARFLARLGVPSEQLEDVLQEVFLVVHGNGGYRPGIAKPTSYLANIAIRAAAHSRRRNGGERKRHSDAAVEHMASDLEDPAHALQVRQDLQRLHLALGRLPEELRTVLVLVEMEGESCLSVAAGLGCPVGTIYWRLHLARKKLQSALQSVDAARTGRARAKRSAEADGHALPARSLIMLFGFDGFRKSEAARLLQLAREQPAEPLSLESRLARHQQLVKSGAELPAWAASCAPHAASWVSLLGPGPVAASFAVGGSVLAAALLTMHAGPAPQGLDAESVRSADVAVVLAAEAAFEAPSTEAARAVETAPEAPLGATGASPLGLAPNRAPRPRTHGGHAEDQTRLMPATGASAASAVPLPLSAEPAPPSPRSEPLASHASERVRSAPSATPALNSPQTRAPSEKRAPEKAPAATDTDLSEMREIALAERLLASDPARALTMTRALQTRFPQSYFREERAYLEVMALSGLGRTREAGEKAAAFLRAYPDGPYTRRVRNTLRRQED